jgi:hypothetical protein
MLVIAESSRIENMGGNMENIREERAKQRAEGSRQREAELQK